MDDARARLLGCFSAVFPDVPPGRLAAVSTETLAAWDSVATVTLVAVIEEEFGVSFHPEDYGRLASFEECLHCLETR